MEKKIITLNITEKDKSLYQYLKDCKDEQTAKNLLTLAVDLYRFSVCNYDLGLGKVSPEEYKRMMNLKSDDELRAIKTENEQELLKWAAWFDPDEVDCGIMRGPERGIWFVEEHAPLGWITLLSHYIRAIDALLAERKK